MWQARLGDVVIAESDHTIEVEGNQYFPPESVKIEFLVASDHTSTCPWKGEAHYYDVRVGDAVAANAAWYYPEPKKEAIHITNHIAFWKDVIVSVA